MSEIHTAEAHTAIAAELVACTLGQRRRIELRTDTAGRLFAVMAHFAAAVMPLGSPPRLPREGGA